MRQHPSLVSLRMAVILVGVALLGGCPPTASSNPMDAGRDTRSSADTGVDAGGSDGRIDPPRPTDPAERFGFYAWGYEPSGLPPGPTDPLTKLSALVRSMGSKSLRVAMDPSDPYGVNGTSTYSLAGVAAQAPYRELFLDPWFRTYMLTAYTSAAYNHVWQDGLSESEADAEREEFRQLTRYLIRTFPNKTFLLSNWEGDNALEAFPTPVALQGFRDWTNARADGVLRGRIEEGGTARVYSVLEASQVRGTTSGMNCGSGGQVCVLTDVVPTTRVDLISYSAWQSLGSSEANLATQLRSDLDTVLGFVQRARPGYTQSSLIIGEIGSARESYGECGAASRMAIALPSAQSWGAGYMFFWQLVDNRYGAGLVTGFGAIAADGHETLMRPVVVDFAARGSATAPTVVCPSIAMNGVTGMSGSLVRGQTATIRGTFMNGPHLVHLRNGSTRMDIRFGTAAWNETSTTITLTIPASFPTGTTLFQVQDVMRRESNAAFVDVTAP